MIRALVAASLLAIVNAAVPAAAANLSVLSDPSLTAAVTKAVTAYQQETGTKVDVIFSSMSSVPKAIADHPAADVILSPGSANSELKDAGLIVGDPVPIIRVGLALGARTATVTPPITSDDSLKGALLAADSVIYMTVGSGPLFAQVVDQLGITDAIKKKATLLPPADIYQALLDRNGTDYVVAPVTAIRANASRGIKLVAVLPTDVQRYLEFTADVLTSSTSPQAAQAFVKFLASPRGQAALVVP